MGTYLYAFLAGEHRRDLGALGLPDGHCRVRTLAASGLAAVVSNYQGDSFADLPKTELLRRLAIHQRVIERAMADHPVLPVKFGTVLDSNAEASRVLETWQKPLSEELSELGNAFEIEVAATWDLKTTFAAIAAQPQIASLAASIAGLSADEITAARIEVGRLVKSALDQRREDYRQEVVGRLSPIVLDCRPNPLPSDELVTNVAFLLQRARLDEFYARVHELDRVFENQLTFRCIGPLPPYSFATVEISRARASELDAARQLLGLGDRVSEKEIHDSYRRLAFQCHPDRNPDDPTAAGRLAAITKAHQKLLSYVQGLESGTDRAGNECRSGVALTTVEDTIILTTGSRRSPLVPSVEEGREPALD